MPKLIPTLTLLAIITIISCLWWADSAIKVGYYFGVTEKRISLGDWGDAFAPLNTLFSGLAFLSVAATVRLQATFNKRSTLQSGKAEFERTYFQIFSLIRELRSELCYSKATPSPAILTNSTKMQRIYKQYHGLDAIKTAYHDVDRRVEKEVQNGPITAERIAKIYNVIVNRRNEAEFSPYYRAVYSLLKRIDVCPFLDETDKLDYSRLLRSQITSHEAVLIGLNGVSPHSKDLKLYLEKYRMLKYAHEGATKSELRKLYHPETFRGRI